jgi:hypothetical protein
MKQAADVEYARILAFPEAFEKHFVREAPKASVLWPAFTRLIRGGLACVTLIAIAIACSGPRAASSAPEQAATSTTPSTPPLDLTSDVPWPTEYRDDWLWLRAAKGDALDRHTLAQREGARGLLVALAHGGELGRTALAALPLALDARDASAELCSAIARAAAPTRAWLLSTLHALLQPDPSLTREPDGEAQGACREPLLLLERDPSLAGNEHDLVASALVYLGQPSAP